MDHEQAAQSLFVDAGAIAVTDTLLARHEPREVFGGSCASCAPSPKMSIIIDQYVARSEGDQLPRRCARRLYAPSSARNQSITRFRRLFHHYTIVMTCKQLSHERHSVAFGEFRKSHRLDQRSTSMR